MSKRSSTLVFRIVLIVLSFLAKNAAAQDVETIEAFIEITPEGFAELPQNLVDTLSITSLDTNTWKEIVGTTNYDEEKKLEKKKTRELKTKELPDKLSFMGIGQVLLILLIAVVLILLIYLIWKQAKNRDVKLNEEDVLWQIDLSDSEDAEALLKRRLAEAQEQGDLSAAIRLHYLQVLNELNKAAWIRWKKDKTNADYIRELRGKEVQKEFRHMTHVFERAWFGKNLPLHASYEEISARFDKLRRYIQVSSSNGAES